jgi:DnaJ-class molecular chaperone
MQAEHIMGILAGGDKKTLLRKYRELSMYRHPDVGGSQEEFTELTEAYNTLLSLCETVDDGSVKVQCIDGTRLDDLGKGYPITESAVTCDGCEGKGYREYSGGAVATGRQIQCPTCGGSGLFSYPCKKCHGSGKYVHPNTGKEVGDCNLCGGSGRFYPEDRKRGGRFKMGWGMRDYFVKYIPGTTRIGYECKDCFGRGEVEEMTDGAPFYRKCEECKGIGEIKMWNPVLRRGLLVANAGRNDEC